MHLDCEQHTLESALSQVARAISSRTPLPILGHVLLEARGGELVLTATDLNVGVQVTMPVHVRVEGATTCSARLISEIVSRFPSGPVELKIHREGSLRISAGRAEFELSTLPAEEFPSLPEVREASTMTLPQGVLKRLVACVGIAAADTDEARPVMTGLLTVLEPGQVTLVATDGRRLARMSQPLAEDPQRIARVVVPARAMAEFVKLLTDAGGEVTVRVAESQIFFSLPGVSFHCRLIEGAFPDFQRVIPSSFQRRCRVAREPLSAALKRMIIVAREKDSPDLVKLEFSSDRLTLSAYTPDLGAAREELPALLEGEPLTIAFNGRYLQDALGVLEGEEIVLDLQDETRSAVLRPDAGEDFEYVCMPVRLREPLSGPRS